MNERVNQWASELIEDIPVGVVVFEASGRASWVNRHMLDMLGIENQDEFLALQDAETSESRTLFARQEYVQLVRDDGSSLYLECRFHDYPQGCAGFYTDVSEKRRLQDTVERLTMNDPLTSMLNWRGIMRELDTLVSRSRRYENSLSVMHVRTGTTEEQAVQAVSRCLREQTRWTDLVGRYSDDSFMVVLPETEEADTSVLIEKIGQAMTSVHELAGLDDVLNVEIAAVQWQRGEDTRLLLERLESQNGTANAA